MGSEVSKIANNDEFVDLTIKGLSKAQISLIKAYFHSIMVEFNQAPPREKMTAKTFSQYLKIPATEAQIVIDFADLDDDGCLDEYDFICLIGLFSNSGTEEKLIALFNLFDTDNSQVITFEELSKMARCIITINLNKLDISQDMVKTKVEEIQSKLFGDTEVTLADFILFAKEDEEFQKALIKIGVLKEGELAQNFNQDIENEINKENRTEDIHDEHFQNKKTGNNLDENGNIIHEQITGDQFMAVRPYLGAVKNSVPSNYNPQNIKKDMPDSTLELEFIHGFRVEDCRNNLRYFNKDFIIFHSAAVGIVMNIPENTQKFNFSNTDDIVGIDTCGEIVVTGQMGHKPIINIFKATDMKTSSIIVGDIMKGIAHVAISNSGKTLGACGMNDDHDLAFYDISNLSEPKLIAKGKGVKDTVFQMKFEGDCDNRVIMATNKEVYYADFKKGSIGISKVVGWGANKCGALSLGFLQKSDAVCGQQDGGISLIRGKSIFKTAKAHKGPVFALWNNKDKSKLFSGGGEGIVQIWDQSLSKINEISLNSSTFKSFNPKIRAICFEETSKKMVIGTRGGEIIEIQLSDEMLKEKTQPKQDRKIVLQCHSDHELWGLACHPNLPEYVTSGEDFLLSKWSIAKRHQILQMKLKFQSKTVSINPKIDQIAVGCNNGTIIFLLYSTFVEIKQVRPGTKEISEMKFSPDGTLLAVGSHDSKIYLFNNKGDLTTTLKGHHSCITHLDFSQNSEVLQTNCTSYELLYWNLKSGKQDTKGASGNRDEAWGSWTCVLGWPVQGIYPPCSDGGDVNSVNRSKNKTVLASGDDFGSVKLFRYPVMPKACFSKFAGHSSHVTNVCFSNDDQYLISIGGNDKSVFQWKHENGEAQSQFQNQEFDNGEFLNVQKDEEHIQQDDGDIQEEKPEEGEQFMAVKPYLGELKKSIPSDYKFVKGMEEPPQESISLQYVNGYRCFDARYTACLGKDKEKIVFVSGAVCIELDTKQNSQRFFQDHENDIVSFDFHPNKEIFASGELAVKGRSKLIDIFVWNVKDMSKINRLTGFHLRGISFLKFTPDGSKLLSFGFDDDNSLAIYDWQKAVLLATSKVDKSVVLDVSFVDDSTFYTCGPKHLKIWTINGANLKGRNVSWGNIKSEAIISLVGINSTTCVAGCGSGKLALLKAGNLNMTSESHKSSVFVLFYDKKSDRIYSGGKDGIVKELQLVNGSLKSIKTFCDFSNSLNPGIRTIDFYEDRAMIGTAANELFYFSNSKDGSKYSLVLNGHFKGELWGLAQNPTNQEYITCGEDCTIRVWDSINRKMKNVVKVSDPLRACDISQNGQLLIAASINGKLFMYDSSLSIEIINLQSGFTKVHQWVQDIKFSPNSNLVALGAHGGASKIEIYEVNVENPIKANKTALKFIGQINAGLTSALLHLDWSLDSNYLVINSEAYELKFVDANARKNVASSSMKDTKWASWTCKIGFPVQGIYATANGFEVNTVCRSSNEKVLATGEDSQLIKLFKYPSSETKAGFKSYKGHSSHVTRVRFSKSDAFLFSIGGNDKTSMIWLTDFCQDSTIKAKNQILLKELSGTNLDQEEDNESEFVNKKELKDKYGNQIKKEFVVQFDEDDLIPEDKADEGTEFMAVKPWLGAIKAPSSYSGPIKDQNNIPNAQVKLEYVYGYRCKDVRNNIFLKDGKILYHAAALAIKLDPISNTQQFFDLHRDDIISIAESNDGIFATGELGPKPRLYLWNSSDMKQVDLLKGGVIKGICGLDFSPNGKFLAAICIDDNHQVAVFNVQEKTLGKVTNGDTARIVDIKWLNNEQFCTVGLKHFKEWTYSKGTLNEKKGNFGNADNKLSCCKKFRGKLLVGSLTGILQIWNGGTCSKSLPIHKQSLDAIFVNKSEERIYTGGKDCVINILNPEFAVLQKIDLNQIIQESLSNKVRAICLDEQEKELYFGTFSSEIFCLKTKGQFYEKTDDIKANQLMSGHYGPNLKWTNEIWGLSLAQGDTFLSASDDATLRLWSTTERKMIKFLNLNIDQKGNQLERNKETGDLADSAQIRSIGICSENKLIAVGCKEGTIRIINFEQWKQVKMFRSRTRWISDLRFSPNNKFLAAGAHDCTIDIYDVEQNFKKLYSMKKHSGAISHIDWSNDSNFLHSNCNAYELLFWDCNSGKQLTGGASALKDESWATWSCTLGWPVQGIFQAEWDGQDINMVDRSWQEHGGTKLIATCDDFSNVRIYRFPCLVKGSKFIILYGHSSHVTNVKFTLNDKWILSTGGEDHCVMQWKMEQLNEI